MHEIMKKHHKERNFRKKRLAELRIWKENSIGKRSSGGSFWRRALVLLLCVSGMLEIGVRAAGFHLDTMQVKQALENPDRSEGFLLNYPRECQLSIRTEEGDCSQEILLIYQLGWEYDPIQEEICWLPDIEEMGLSGRIIEEKELPSLIMELERRMRKEEPMAVLQLGRAGLASITVPSGVYLLVQDSPRKQLIQSSLVAVPCMNDQGDGWVNERELYLKTASIPEESEPGNPNTGDSTPRTGYLLMLLISSLAIVLLYVMKEKIKY